MSPDPLQVPVASGVLHLDRYFSYLRVNGSSGEEKPYLLLLHNSPTGVPDSQTAGYATSYLLHDLGKTEGSPLTVWGFSGTIGSTSVIAIVRAQ